MTNIFTAPLDTSQQMADHLPNGRVWGRKNVSTSNIRKMLNSLSVVHNISQQQIELLNYEFDINTTTSLITEWETSVGIPTDCHPDISSDSIELRRNNVIERLRRDPIVTLAEMQAFADVLLDPTVVTLYNGLDCTNADYLAFIATGPPYDKKQFLVAEIEAIGESFQFEFQIPFSGGVDTTRFTCEMNKVIPANITLLFYYV